jgi:hypothetical protein
MINKIFYTVFPKNNSNNIIIRKELDPPKIANEYMTKELILFMFKCYILLRLNYDFHGLISIRYCWYTEK